jgi:tRNA(Ile)-lysidine synthase TilS/MesJ
MKNSRKGIIDYHMISDEGGIMVGLSGGKDSLTLLAVLKAFLKSSKYKFPLAAGHVSLGYDDDLAKMASYCAEMDVPFYYERTNITEIVFDIRKEKNPCSLCAKMRRGALNSMAKKYGYPKVALAHHLDDVVETLLLNMCFEGRLDSFKPVTWLSNQKLWVIRPLIYVSESDIKGYSNKIGLPIINSCCPANGKTKREDMKQIIMEMSKLNPRVREQALRALQNNGKPEWKIINKKKVK